MFTLKTNAEKHGIELYFDGIPAITTRNALKAASFRWNSAKKCWYTKDTPAARQAAESLNDTRTSTPAETVAAPAKKALAPLWDRTRTDDLPAYGTNNDLKHAARAFGTQYDKHAAEIMRKHLRERFPEVKFSIRSGHAGYLDNVDGEIISSPYAYVTVAGDPNAASCYKRYDHREPSAQLQAVLDYCNALHDAFDADDGDNYADYGAHHDLYGNFSIASGYEQTEPTKEQAADIAAFETAKKTDEKRKAAELERQFREDEERRKKERIEAEKREAEAQKIAADIAAHVKIKDLAGDEQIAVCDVRTGIGKECNLDELKETIKENDERADRGESARRYEDCIISRKVSFESETLFKAFCNMFLRDFDFLAGKGGAGCEDARVKSWDDYNKLTNEQRASVHTFCTDCIGVYLCGKLQFVIDPEGYNYARYVYLPTDATITRPAAFYRDGWRQTSETLPAFYMPDTLKNQLAAADLKAGDPVTVLSLDGWIIMATEQRGVITQIKPCKWAQYDDAAYIEIIPAGKRKAHGAYYHAGQDVVIYRGILPPIPDELKYTTHGSGLVSVNYAGCGAYSYIRAAIGYYKEQGFAPVIDLIQR